MPTGDGIQRVTKSESLLTPSWGEGGSVPQALGSKAEERAKRRKKKKDSYAQYLESSQWKKIRRRALDRDKHKCLACGQKAEHVHHIRYPKNLGEEKMEWLYSLCASCHNEIHRLAQKMILRKATHQVLGTPPRPKKTKSHPSKPKKPKSNKELRREERLRVFKTQTKGQMRPSKRLTLAAENERLHEIPKRARERRQA